MSVFKFDNIDILVIVISIGNQFGDVLGIIVYLTH